MNDLQRTLKREYIFEGKGLHSGMEVTMVVAPAPENTGVRFYRKDIAQDVYIGALADYVTSTQRSTTLEKGNIRISTTEHLLSALYGLGVDNAYVTLDTFEVPILDGSALPYTQAISADGLQEQNARRKYYEVKEKIYHKDEKSGSEITILPDDDFSIDLSIDFNSKVLGVQNAHYDKSIDFVKELAPSRTFVFFHELEFLLKNNLIKGGDLGNAIVIVEHPVSDKELDRITALFNISNVKRISEGYLDNVSLHFPNECARHKLLDLIGDLFLVGCRIKGKVIAEKSGHKINTDVAKILREKILQGK